MNGVAQHPILSAGETRVSLHYMTSKEQCCLWGVPMSGARAAAHSAAGDARRL